MKKPEREKRQEGAKAARADGEPFTVPDAWAKFSPVFFGLKDTILPLPPPGEEAGQGSGKNSRQPFAAVSNSEKCSV